MRKATATDVPAIAACVNRAYEKYIPRIGRKPKPMLADYAKAITEHQLWLLEVEGHIQGLLELIPETDHLLIENIAVNPDSQGQGIGRGLMRFAEDQARNQKKPELRLYTNAAFVENIAFYKKLDYRETKREPFKGGTLVFMSKSVKV